MRVTERIQRRLILSTAREARLSSWRVLTFAVGLALTCVLVLLKSAAANAVAAVALALFVVLYAVHVRERNRLRLLTGYQKILSREEAKRSLAWSQLPPLPEVKQSLPRYFFDLDLLGESSLLRLLHVPVSTSGFRELVELFRSQAVSAETILERQAIVKDLLPRRAFRRKILLRAQIDSEAVVDLEGLDEFLAEPFHSAAAPVWVAALGGLQALSIALMIPYLFRAIGPWFLAPWFASFVVFSLALSHFQNPFGRSVHVETTLTRFLRISKLLERFHATRGSRLEGLLTPFHEGERPSALLRKLGFFVSLLSVRAHPVVYVAIHMFFPWDFIVTLWLERLRARLRGDIATWSQALARLESYLSLAELGHLFPETVFAEVADEAREPFLEADEARHPLIARKTAVANSVRIDQASRCHLITGSNMSGKSTFLRTIGLNVLLSKAGAPCFAKRLRFTNVAVYTVLRIHDSVENHVSSFYAEVRALKEILEAASLPNGVPVLYLIDEIFRGTNNRERLLGSRAYIEKILTFPASGLIATHDLELTEIAKEHPSVVNSHFKETITNGKMEFSYRKESGPCPTTNALKIMAMEGLPVP